MADFGTWSHANLVKFAIEANARLLELEKKAVDKHLTQQGANNETRPPDIQAPSQPG